MEIYLMIVKNVLKYVLKYSLILYMYFFFLDKKESCSDIVNENNLR